MTERSVKSFEGCPPDHDFYPPLSAKRSTPLEWKIQKLIPDHGIFS